MDGVVTRTARAHAAAWKRTFDEYLRARPAGREYEPFDDEADYYRYVDGRPRYEGARGFLQSRGILLPWGDPHDPSGKETVCGLGNRKNRYFLEFIANNSVEAFDSTADFVRGLKADRKPVAVISSSRNAKAVLEAAGVAELFDAVVDGEDSAALGLKGKPAPDIFLEAAKRLGVEPERTIVVEDAVSGVEAGRAGGFGLVIGIDRSGRNPELKNRGADIVLGDLSEITTSGADKPPSALENMDEIIERLQQGRPAIFLDYDSALTPIVDDPSRALLPENTRQLIRKLAEHWTVVIMSGRSLYELKNLVGLGNLVYAGSHGFSLLGPEESFHELRLATDWGKDRALLYLLEKLHINSSRIVPLYIGSGIDEAVFQATADKGIGILAGDEYRPAAARYVLRHPGEVAEFLGQLVKLAEEEPTLNVWSLIYEGFEPRQERARESLCTLGNGRFATRGAAPEAAADDVHYPGTYVAGVYNILKSGIAGRVIENESMVNLPNWLPLTFRIEDGDWFDLRSVEIIDYKQELDMLWGMLVRTVRFEDKKKRRTKLTQRRFVHMSNPHLAGLETTIVPENWSGKIQVRSALDGRVKNTLVKRYRGLANDHLRQLGSGEAGKETIWLEAETSQSKIRIAEAARTKVFFDEEEIGVARRLLREPGYVGHEFDLKLQEGRPLRVEKIVSIFHSRETAISESLFEARQALRYAGSFGQLMARQSLAWSHLWEHWYIDIRGQNRHVERNLNLHIFHLLQTVSPNTIDLDVGVPPRGLHGEAYRGLVMWDDLFIFPLLNLRVPDITLALLKYRYRRLHWAARAATRAGYGGAMFPWQSGSNGQERAQTVHLNPRSGRWVPDNSRLAQHISIAVAYNIWQYFQATGNQDFLSFYGAELMIGVARFWADKVEYNESLDRYEIRGVIGPDEFHDRYPDSERAGIDNNAYTNVMAAWVFWRALEMLDMLSEERRQFILEDFVVRKEEPEKWNDISRKLLVPFHDDGIISQFAGYGELEEFDWESYRRKYDGIQRLDRILEAEGDSPNRYKLSKQADVLMLFYLLSADELRQLFERLNYPFEHETIPKNVEYYLQRTSHGSTLSRVVHSWVLSRSNREMSWHLLQAALESDLNGIQGGTTGEGIHLGAMAGTVDLIMRCYSGIESRGDVLWFNPSLPLQLHAMRFKLRYRGSWLEVEISSSRLSLRSRQGPQSPVKIGVSGKTFVLAPGEVRQFHL